MTKQEREGYVLSGGVLISLITVVVAYGAAFATIRSMSLDNKRRIDRVEDHYDKTEDKIQEIAISVAKIVTKLDLDILTKEGD